MRQFLSILLALSLFSAVLTAEEAGPSAPALEQALAVQQAPATEAQQSLFASVQAPKASDQELESAEGQGVVGAIIGAAANAYAAHNAGAGWKETVVQAAKGAILGAIKPVAGITSAITYAATNTPLH